MRLSRRWVLQAGAAGLALPFTTYAAPKNLRGGEVLPDPDFTKLHETRPHLVGVRPHRKGGVRLELDERPLDGKPVIHNYGHGGGGITLSWGSASVVVELMEQALQKLGEKKPSVAVLGAGVIGLTTATELERRWPELPITVYAKSLDPKTTTSFVAGGQFEPSGVFHEYEKDAAKKERLCVLLRRSRDRIVELQRSGKRERFGVAERKNYTLDHPIPALDDCTPRDVVAAPRRGALPFAKLNVAGREYSNWLMNPTLLLPTLASDLAAAGVKFEARTLESAKDVAMLPESVVVNCTGLGAKTLFGDEALQPQRGHLVVLQKTDPKHFWFFSGGCANFAISYVFCRQDDIVLGGTVFKDQDSVELTKDDDAHFERILANAKVLFGGQPRQCKP